MNTRNDNANQKRDNQGTLFHWLLVVTLLVTGYIPAHYHLHHDASTDAFTHAHIIDLHLLSDETHGGHHEIDAPSFTAVPDNALTPPLPNLNLSPFAVITVLLLVLALAKYHTCFNRTLERFRLPRYRPHFSPLLRGPPHA